MYSTRRPVEVLKSGLEVSLDAPLVGASPDGQMVKSLTLAVQSLRPFRDKVMIGREDKVMIGREDKVMIGREAGKVMIGREDKLMIGNEELAMIAGEGKVQAVPMRKLSPLRDLYGRRKMKLRTIGRHSCHANLLNGCHHWLCSRKQTVISGFV